MHGTPIIKKRLCNRCPTANVIYLFIGFTQSHTRQYLRIPCGYIGEVCATVICYTYLKTDLGASSPEIITILTVL